MTEEKNIVGELTEVESQQLAHLQNQANTLYNQIGQFEVQKMILITQVGVIEQQGKQIMNTIAERCGIEQGVRWQINEDKKVQVQLVRKGRVVTETES